MSSVDASEVAEKRRRLDEIRRSQHRLLTKGPADEHFAELADEREAIERELKAAGALEGPSEESLISRLGQGVVVAVVAIVVALLAWTVVSLVAESDPCATAGDKDSCYQRIEDEEFPP